MSPSATFEGPTETDVSSLRSAILSEVASFDVDFFDDRDVARIEHDDLYIRRFLLQNGSEDLAVKTAIEALRWRKKFRVNDLRSRDVDRRLLSEGGMFAHNRDREGCKLLIFSVRKYEKQMFEFIEVKRLLSYWLDRIEREEYGKKVTVVFDLSDAGLENVDLQFVRHLIKLFKFYHPWMLSKVILYDMPWIIQAVWKLIYSWLPSSSAEKIRFADKKTIDQFIDKDQQLLRWGGTDQYEFEFREEVPGNTTPWLNSRSLHLM
ncbi:motile sperm domain-containing protein 2-like [Hyalella azteca]|uniref:Motile sperm domain-containing protein 2-like n=1 Tax=Hyalella azteca TaxID=294128 RepID=A0A8B7NM60_HYAAZ|nr:motile sperm domain-containing protein 2-like [Hyalella azteca]